MKLFLLVGVGLLWGTTALGQTDNKYLDDAYYRRSDLRKIDKEERRKAELRRAAERAEREAWEKEQAALIATYKKKQADRELDAYNGHLTLPEDTITLTRAELGRLLKEQRSSAYRGESDPEVYGPYSSRLSRFYGSGSMTIQGARRVYIDADPWYSDLDYRYAGSDVYVRVGSRDPYWGSRYGWGASWGWGSWYDPYYSYGSYWGYPRYYGSWYGGYYDPYYYGYYRGYYGGYYGSGYGYGYGSYYDYYPGYYYGYAAGAATRSYREHYYNNPYLYEMEATSMLHAPTISTPPIRTIEATGTLPAVSKSGAKSPSVPTTIILRGAMTAVLRSRIARRSPEAVALPRPLADAKSRRTSSASSSTSLDIQTDDLQA